MWKKSVCGLTLLIAGLLVWSCGDGSVDSLTDTELLMISRFPSTIDYDMLDSIVKACEKDEACWEKAKKTGEIYKGDYTKVLRDSSGNIVIVEGDSAFIYDKSGKKLPVFNFSSNSNDDDDDDVTSSGSTATSGSSSKSSGSGFEDGGGYTDDGTGQDAGGGSGTSAIHVDRSSSSKKTGTSSSVDLSFLSSSSKGKVDLDTTSTDNKSSSSSKVSLSANSESSGTSGGSVKPIDYKCGQTPVAGTCKPDNEYPFLGDDVTYTYTPSAGTCQNGDILWRVGDVDVAPRQQEGGMTFTVLYGTLGDKTQVTFTMDSTRVSCEMVILETGCNCTLKGKTVVDWQGSTLTTSDSIFTWVVSGCASETNPKIDSYSWTMGNKTGNARKFEVKLDQAGVYTPEVVVTDKGGVESNPVCPSLKVRVPVNVTSLGTEYTIEDGQQVKLSGTAASSGTTLKCNTNSEYVQSSCTIEMAGVENLTKSVANCGNWLDFSFPVSNFSNGVAIFTMQGFSGNEPAIKCTIN
jgi:hypothetical protein